MRKDGRKEERTEDFSRIDQGIYKKRRKKEGSARREEWKKGTKEVVYEG